MMKCDATLTMAGHEWTCQLPLGHEGEHVGEIIPLRAVWSQDHKTASFEPPPKVKE